MGTVFDRAQYNAYRRTRTLEAFIPLPPQKQRDLVRGWYVAALLGYLDGIDGIDGAEVRPRVWSPEGWLAFPSPLLGEPVNVARTFCPRSSSRSGFASLT